MKRSITLLTVLLVIAVFVMPSYAKETEVSRTPVRFEKDFIIDNYFEGGVTFDQTDLGMKKGQLLVIEYVSLYVRIFDTTNQIQDASITIRPVSGGSSDLFFLSPVNPIIDLSAIRTVYSIGQTLRLYVNDTEKFTLFVVLKNVTNAEGVGTISGYIIDSDYNSLSP